MAQLIGEVILGESARIDPTAVIGPDGMSVKKDGLSNTLVRHEGGVVIGSFVEIGPMTVVHRATKKGSNTVISFGTLVGSQVNVGHNVWIGSNCVITSNVVIGGSVKISDNVWIGLGVIIKPHITICRDVAIGAGSLVLDDITVPGYYVGSPCRWYKVWDGEGKPF